MTKYIDSYRNFLGWIINFGCILVVYGLGVATETVCFNSCKSKN